MNALEFTDIHRAYKRGVDVLKGVTFSVEPHCGIYRYRAYADTAAETRSVGASTQRRLHSIPCHHVGSSGFHCISLELPTGALGDSPRGDHALACCEFVSLVAPGVCAGTEAFFVPVRGRINDCTRRWGKSPWPVIFRRIRARAAAFPEAQPPCGRSPLPRSSLATSSPGRSSGGWRLQSSLSRSRRHPAKKLEDRSLFFIIPLSGLRELLFGLNPDAIDSLGKRRLAVCW